MANTLHTETSPQLVFGLFRQILVLELSPASTPHTFFLPLPSKCWDDSCVPAYAAQGFYGRIVKITNYYIINMLNIS